MSIESACTIGAIASKKASPASPVSRPIARGQRVRGQGAGREMMTLSNRLRDGSSTSSRRIVNQRMGRERGGHGGGKAVAIDRQRAAGRHLMGVAARAGSASPSPASRDAGRRRRWSRRRPSGTSWSRRVRRSRRSCARRSGGRAASRAGRRARRRGRSARRLPSRRGRRRRYEWGRGSSWGADSRRRAGRHQRRKNARRREPAGAQWRGKLEGGEVAARAKGIRRRARSCGRRTRYRRGRCRGRSARGRTGETARAPTRGNGATDAAWRRSS
jgi:hypothetical protein